MAVAGFQDEAQLDAAIAQGIIKDPMLINSIRSQLQVVPKSLNPNYVPTPLEVREAMLGAPGTENGPIITAQDSAAKAKQDPAAKQAAYLNAKASGATSDQALASIGGATPPTVPVSIAGQPYTTTPGNLLGAKNAPGPWSAVDQIVGMPTPVSTTPPPATLPIQPAPAHPTGIKYGGGGFKSVTGPSDDHGNFGKLPAQIELEQQNLKHMGDQAGFQNQLSAIEIEKGKAAEAKIAQLALEAHAREEAMRIQQKRRENTLNKFEAESAIALDDYMKSEVNPNHYWESKSTAGKISSLVSVALGGIGQVFMAKAGRDPGPNSALDMIQDAIRQDIDLQKVSIAKKGLGLEARKGLYSQMLQRFGSEDAAEAMTYQAGLQRAMMDADATAAKYDNKAVTVRAEALKSDLAAGIAGYQTKTKLAGQQMYADKLAADKKASAAAAAANAAKLSKQNEKDDDAVRQSIAKNIDLHGGSQARVSPALAAKYAAENPGKAPLAVGQLVWIKPDGKAAPMLGSGGGEVVKAPVIHYAPDGAKTVTTMPLHKDDAAAIKKANVAYEDIMAKTNRLKELRAKHGGGWLSAGGILTPDRHKDAVEAKSIAGQLKLSVKAAAELGAPSESDWKLVDEIKGKDPTSYGDEADVTLDSVQNWATQKYQSVTQNAMVDPNQGGIPMKPVE